MAGMSTYLIDAALDHVVGNTALTSPTTVYVQVHIGDPTGTGTANQSEHTTRYAVSFGAAAGRVASNDAQVDINNVSLTGDETWNGLSIWDASTNGNCLFFGNLASGVLMQNGDSFAFAIGDIDVSLGGAYTNYLANALLDHCLGTAALTQPAGRFAKFHIGDPGLDATGNVAGETARADCGTFNAASAGATANAATVGLTNVSTAETWSHVSIWDTVGPAGGNPLLQGALTVSKTLQVGDDAEFAAGELDVTFA